jgi:hypothetical protein
MKLRIIYGKLTQSTKTKTRAKSNLAATSYLVAAEAAARTEMTYLAHYFLYLNMAGIKTVQRSPALRFL